MRRGLIDSLDWMRDSWKVNGGKLTADRVFLATGSVPIEPDGFPGVPSIPLDDALIPHRLEGDLAYDCTCCLFVSAGHPYFTQAQLPGASCLKVLLFKSTRSDC